jgi:hypothetical protein
MNTGIFVKLQGLEMDIREFFILPIPKTVWESLKMFQDAEFTAFVESCLCLAAANSFIAPVFFLRTNKMGRYGTGPVKLPVFSHQTPAGGAYYGAGVTSSKRVS